MSPPEFEEASASFRPAQAKLNGVGIAATAEELDRLAHLSPFEYGQHRIAVAERFHLPVPFLDQEIEARRRKLLPGGTQGAGHPLNLLVIEPAPDPVNGGKALELVISALERYVVLPPHAALAIALWIFRAHADDCFDINPRAGLAVSGEALRENHLVGPHREARAPGLTDLECDPVRDLPHDRSRAPDLIDR